MSLFKIKIHFVFYYKSFSYERSCCSPTGSCSLGEDSSLRVHRWRNPDPDDVLADVVEDKDKVDMSRKVFYVVFLYRATCFPRD